MSRLDEALRHLRAGEAAVLVDEDDPGRCSLFAAPGDRDARTLEDLAGEGAGSSVLWVEPALVADGVSVPERPGTLVRQVAAYGVLAVAGIGEAAVDAIRMAGGRPAALTLAVPLAGGVLAQPRAAADFAAGRGLPLVSIQDVVAERLSRETIVEAVASARLPSLYAASPLNVRAFRSLVDGSEHLAVIHRPLGAAPLVRLHSECLTGDALGSLRCDCGDQLRASLRLIAEHPEGGVVVYLRGQEGRGIGLANKIRAYALQDTGRDTVDANLDLGFPADLRSYVVAVQILRELGLRKARVLTNNPAKMKALERYGIAVVERVALRIDANPLNAAYLDTKRRRMGHDFEPVRGAGAAGDR